MRIITAVSTSPALPIFDYPELNTGEETGEAILDERIEVAIALWGTLLVSADDAIANNDAYNIMMARERIGISFASFITIAPECIVYCMGVIECFMPLGPL